MDTGTNNVGLVNPLAKSKPTHRQVTHGLLLIVLIIFFPPLVLRSLTIPFTVFWLLSPLALHCLVIQNVVYVVGSCVGREERLPSKKVKLFAWCCTGSGFDLGLHPSVPGSRGL